MTRPKPGISTEQLLTSPAGFGISTATPAQRAACRIIDGRPLGDLRDHPDAIALVGGAEALAKLPSERSVQPTEVVFLASIRSAKTIIACAAALRASQTVDVSKLGPGEIPRISNISLKIDLSAVAQRILTDTVRASPLLSKLLIEETADSLVLRHPSGRPIEIACVAGAKAGASLVARWSGGVNFDEAPRMNGASDGVVNLDHGRTAVLGRLLRGAQVLHIGSAWAPHGPIYDLVQEYWTRPNDNIVVLRGTGPMLNPTWWTPERCDKLQEQDPVAFQTDVMGEFADPESGLLNPVSVRMNTRESPMELEPERRATYAAAVDPAEGSAGGNAWTCVIVQRIDEEKPDGSEARTRFRVAVAREWRGMRPEQCLEQIAELCRRYGLKNATSDQYAASANKDLAARYGLHLDIRPVTAKSKLEDFTNLATLIHSDAVELSPDPQLRRDLLSVKRRVTQQGVTIVLPRTGDGRHADYAPSLATAVTVSASALAPGEPIALRIPGRFSETQTGNSLRAARIARWKAAGLIHDDDEYN